MSKVKKWAMNFAITIIFLLVVSIAASGKYARSNKNNGELQEIQQRLEKIEQSLQRIEEKIHGR